MRRAFQHLFLGVRGTFALIACMALLIVAPYAAAQTAAVLPMENRGVAETDFADIVEESAFLVTDHGALQPIRHYELADWVGQAMATQVATCGSDPECLQPLYAAGVDFVVGVSARMGASGVQVRYELFRLEDAVRVADEAATPSDARDFAALPAALNRALDRRGGPALGIAAPAPAPPVVAPAYAPPAYTPSPVAPVRRSDNPRGPLAPVAIATGATGGALLLGGVLLGFAADDTQQEIQSMPHPADEVERLQKQGRSRQSAANALLISGGVLATTGIVLAIVDRPRESGVALSIGVRPQGISARLRF